MSRRLLSLDILRGITVAVMILVNTSGDSAHTYFTLKHSKWNGCSLADTVFPCFLFMVGASIVFAMQARMAKGVSRAVLVGQILKRAAILFLFGIAVNGFPLFELHTLRIYGVLQRIALCFVLASLVVLFTKASRWPWIVLGLLAGYWVLLRWVPVPGFGLPVRDVPLLDPAGNLAAWLDRKLVPASHLYHHTFYDPEGLLGTLPSVASTLIGSIAAQWLRSAHENTKKLQGLLLAGAGAVIAGLVWNPWFPINKRLWTSSYVLLTAGISLLVLALVYWLADWKPSPERTNPPRWAYPALVFGTNALGAYIFSEFLASLLGAWQVGQFSVQKILYHPITLVVTDPYLAALTYAVLFVGVCFLPVLYLYRKKIFLKV